jgi:uncharacterized protein YbjT (DUF2867 family)
MAGIVLTGVTGRVGGMIAAQLTAQGVPFAVAARDPARAARLAPAASAWHAADFESPGNLQKAFAHADKLFLIAGDHPQQDQLEINAIEAAGLAGVKHIVKLSAQSAAWQPPRSFGAMHSRAERVLQDSGMQFSMLQPVFFQQSLLRFASGIKHMGKIVLPAGLGACAFVDARDVAEVAVAALSSDAHAGQTYVLTGPSAQTFLQVAALIAAATGRPVDYIGIPADAARAELPKASGMPTWLVDLVVELLEGIAAGNQSAVSGDIEKVLGRRPRTLEAFIAEHAAAFYS